MFPKWNRTKETILTETNAKPAGETTAADVALSWRAALLCVALAATAVITPMLFLGNASGHDIQFHLASWMDAAGQWREGIVLPRWAEWANWGFGEPRFIFYPPASWLAGAALGSLLPWRIVPGAFIWLALVGAGMAMWTLAREWLRPREAIAAAVLFAVNPYHLVIAYYRSDFAELGAAALLPLLVWAALGAARGQSRRALLLAIVFAGSWLWNAPEGVIATYALALLFIVECVARRSFAPLVRGGSAMTGGFGLAAFYILPAWWEERWVQISYAASDYLDVARNFLFTHSTDADFMRFNWKVSAVAVGMMAATAAAAILAWRNRRESPEIWRPEIRRMLAVLAVASTLLMFPVTLFLWRRLPELQFVQFPWRWLGPLGVPFAFFPAVAIHRGGKWRGAWLAILIGAGTIGAGVAMVRSAWWDSNDAAFVWNEIRSGHGYEGADEYQPIGCDRSELPGSPDAAKKYEPPIPRVTKLDPKSSEMVPAAGVRLHIARWSAERKTFDAETAAPVTLALRLVNYPAWQVRVDGAVVQPQLMEDTAQMLLPLGPGRHRVEAHFRRTWDRTLGGAISLLFGGAMLVFWVRSRRAAGAL